MAVTMRFFQGNMDVACGDEEVGGGLMKAFVRMWRVRSHGVGPSESARMRGVAVDGGLSGVGDEGITWKMVVECKSDGILG